MQQFEGKVVLITGGGGGIGRATAELFAEAGAHVAVVDRDADAARDVAEAIMAAGRNAAAYALDVTDETAVERTFASIVEAEGRLDILVNNAGIAIRKPAVELPLADWDAVVAVNMTGVFVCSRAAARHMLRQGSGVILAFGGYAPPPPGYHLGGLQGRLPGHGGPAAEPRVRARAARHPRGDPAQRRGARDYPRGLARGHHPELH